MSSCLSMIMVWGNVYNARREQSGSGGSSASTVDRVEWNPCSGWRECEITVEDIEDEFHARVDFYWLTCRYRLDRVTETRWKIKIAFSSLQSLPRIPPNRSESSTICRQMALSTTPSLQVNDIPRSSLAPEVPCVSASSLKRSLPVSRSTHRLKRFDESAASSRKGSQAPTPPRSVVGIGNKGM